MSNPLGEDIKKQTLKFLESLLPDVCVTPDQLVELKKYGFDPSAELIARCVQELIQKLYYEPNSRYAEMINNMVLVPRANEPSMMKK